MRYDNAGSNGVLVLQDWMLTRLRGRAGGMSSWSDVCPAVSIDITVIVRT